jgi:hypothetical protein
VWSTNASGNGLGVALPNCQRRFHSVSNGIEVDISPERGEGMPGIIKLVARPPRPALALLSIVTIIAFFLPWVKLFGLRFAGYELAKLHLNLSWLWLIPIFATANVAALLSFQRLRSVCVTSFAAGLCPLVAFLYLLFSTSIEVFKILSAGAYLSVVSSAGLLFYTVRYWVSSKL